uniref:CSON007745 protein n=1 Tax=Culicoides sonorensis TaxID=179676 RepID=A0A336MUL6_CULSO
MGNNISEMLQAEFPVTFKCHGCKTPFKPDNKVLQCKTGHNFCEGCKETKSECHECNETFLGTRNLALEEIVKQAHETDKKGFIQQFESPKLVLGKPSEAPGWIKCDGKELPGNAVVGGEFSGVPSYVGRALHDGSLIPGKINPNTATCFVGWNGNEFEKDEFEVLCGINSIWVKCSGANIPSNAFPGGKTHNGELLYIGRANHNGTLAIGSVQKSYSACFVSYAEKEYEYKDYEIFVTDDASLITPVIATVPETKPVAATEKKPDIEEKLWRSCIGTNVPANAVQGGHDVDEEPLYIGRVKHEGAITPGKVNADHGLCYVPFGGKEYSRNEYEVLCGVKGSWIPCTQDNIPKNAFIGGKTETGETLYIGRVKHENTITLGKVKPSAEEKSEPDFTKFDEIFSCPICYENFRPKHKIVQCKLGHSICERCFGLVTGCPVCRNKFEGTRNFIMEELINQIYVVEPDKLSNLIHEIRVKVNERIESDNGENPNVKNLVWVPSTSNPFPNNAVSASYNKQGHPLYIGRVKHGHSLLPGKVNPLHKLCYYSYNGFEHSSDKYETLVAINDSTENSWKSCSDGDVPNNAFPVGQTEDGEVLYVGRAFHEGVLTHGQIQPSKGVCMLPFYDLEVKVRNYEVFVDEHILTWISLNSINMADALKLDDILSCPVCYENFKPNMKILQCRSGHAMCESCHEKLKECPVCKEVLIGTRNFVMEEMIKKLRRLSTGALMSLDDDVSPVATTGEDLNGIDSDTDGDDADGVENEPDNVMSEADKKKEAKKAKKKEKMKLKKQQKQQQKSESGTNEKLEQPSTSTASASVNNTTTVTSGLIEIKSPQKRANSENDESLETKRKKIELRENLSIKDPAQPKGLFPCPTNDKDQPESQCQSKIPFCRIYNHLRSIHPDRLLTTEATIQNNDLVAHCELDIKVPVADYRHVIKVKEFGLFVLVFSAEREMFGEECTVNLVKAFVKVVGTVSVGKQFSYKLEVAIGKYVAKCADFCHHSFTDESTLVPTEQCLTLKVSKLSRFARLKLEISKNTGSRARQPLKTEVQIIPNFGSTNHQGETRSANQRKTHAHKKKKNKKH